MIKKSKIRSSIPSHQREVANVIRKPSKQLQTRNKLQIQSTRRMKPSPLIKESQFHPAAAPYTFTQTDALEFLINNRKHVPTLSADNLESDDEIVGRLPLEKHFDLGVIPVEHGSRYLEQDLNDEGRSKRWRLSWVYIIIVSNSCRWWTLWLESISSFNIKIKSYHMSYWICLSFNSSSCTLLYPSRCLIWMVSLSSRFVSISLLWSSSSSVAW